MTNPNPGPGRPSLLDDDRAQRIVDAVTAGNYLKVAAQWAGITDRTLHYWLARGRRAQAAVEQHDKLHLYCPECDADRGEVGQPMSANPADNRCGTCGTLTEPAPWRLSPDEDRYLQFLHRVTRASASAEVGAVIAWRGAFTDDWRAARDFLVYGPSRERWQRVTHINITPDEAERRIDAALGEALDSLTDTSPGADPTLDADLAEAIGHDDLDDGQLR